MLQSTIIMIALAFALFFLAKRSGAGKPTDGLRLGARMFWQTLPLLLAAFVVASMIEVLIPAELVASWLGEGAGLKGVALGAAAGLLTPGGPYVTFPMVAAIYRAGAGIGTIVAYITAWAMWSVGNLSYEFAFTGPRFTLIRMVSTLIFPFLAGIIAHTLF